MSYVVEIVRPITPEEFLALIDEDASLTLIERGDGWVEASWRDGDDGADFSLAQGRIAVTSPSDRAWAKAQDVARRLRARVIGEEDETITPRATDPALVASRSFNLGWPIVAIVLGALLLWKW